MVGLFMGIVPRSARIFGDSIRWASTSPVMLGRAWRKEQGLPANRCSEGPLVDGPDYTFLDGRPTPLLTNQKLRMEKQRSYAQSIVQLNSELDFAVEREKRMQREEEQRRESILKSRLKPKGHHLSKK